MDEDLLDAVSQYLENLHDSNRDLDSDTETHYSRNVSEGSEDDSDTDDVTDIDESTEANENLVEDVEDVSSDSDGESDRQTEQRSRKRKRRPELWKVNIRKKRKAEGKRHWDHKGRKLIPKKERMDTECKCAVRCRTKFTEDEKDRIFSKFWKMANHVVQNTYLQCLIHDKPAKVLANGNHRAIHEYHLQMPGRTETVCKRFFCGIHGIKETRLKRKVLRKDLCILDGRGKHGKHRCTNAEVENGVRIFLQEMPRRQSHYSQRENANVNYLDSTWNCTRLYLEYRRQTLEAGRRAAKLHKFRQIFNYEFNLKFGFLRSDKCKTCEDIAIALLQEKSERRPNEAKIQELKESLDSHQIKAQKFYDSIRSSKETDETTFAICMDYGSNLALPTTRVGEEFYNRQLWLHNLCFHNLKTRRAHMFLYAEHFAKKSNNEVISALKYYVEKIVPAGVRRLHIFADNCFAQNKNSVLYAGLQAFLHSRFESIKIQYAEVGHSRMAADADFGKIVVRAKSYEKIYGPSEWVQIIEEANRANPFTVIYLEKPCTDDLASDGKPVVRVKDYKSVLLPKVNPRLKGISKLKSVLFMRGANPLIEDADDDNLVGKPFPLLKQGVTVRALHDAFRTAKTAYSEHLEVTEAKVENILTLLKHVDMRGRDQFYKSIPGVNLDKIKKLPTKKKSVNRKNL